MTRIAISSGHGLYVRGASGIIDEVDEARKVVERLAEELSHRGVDVFVFHDDKSKSQGDNLNAIVNAHNGQDRELDISVHFNAFEQREGPVGTEVLYLTQHDLADRLSAAIAEAGGFIDRGPKKRTDLKFLNATDEPAVLIETCFVDSEADCDLYAENFEDICDAIADVLGGVEEVDIPVVEPPTIDEHPPDLPRVDIVVEGDVLIFVNGQQVGTKG